MFFGKYHVLFGTGHGPPPMLSPPPSNQGYQQGYQQNVKLEIDPYQRDPHIATPVIPKKHPRYRQIGGAVDRNNTNILCCTQAILIRDLLLTSPRVD